MLSIRRRRGSIAKCTMGTPGADSWRDSRLTSALSHLNSYYSYSCYLVCNSCYTTKRCSTTQNCHLIDTHGYRALTEVYKWVQPHKVYIHIHILINAHPPMLPSCPFLGIFSLHFVSFSMVDSVMPLTPITYLKKTGGTKRDRV